MRWKLSRERLLSWAEQAGHRDDSDLLAYICNLYENMDERDSKCIDQPAGHGAQHTGLLEPGLPEHQSASTLVRSSQVSSPQVRSGQAHQADPGYQANQEHQEVQLSIEQDLRFASRHEEAEADKAHMLDMIIRHPDLPVTKLYQRCGFGGATGAKVRRQLGHQGLITEWREIKGRLHVYLKPTKRAAEWLSMNHLILELRRRIYENDPNRLADRQQTKRFGGQQSRELDELVVPWAKLTMNARYLGAEVPDGFRGGRWDHLFELPDKSMLVVECCTGQSRQQEVLHVRKALQRGIPIITVCLDETIHDLLRRHLAEEGIQVDGVNVRLFTAAQVRDELKSAQLRGG